jgi:NAD-dependent deacetylase
LLKPDVVLFGEALPMGAMERAARAVSQCDLLIAVGSTLAVHPVASLVPMAKANFAKVVIVNRGATAYDGLADARLDGSISELLPRLLEAPAVRMRDGSRL